MNVTSSKVLVALSIKNRGDWDQIHRDIKSYNMPNDELLAEAERLIENGEVLTIVDDGYPKALLESGKPPFVLFFQRKDGPSIDRIDAYVQRPQYDWSEYEVKAHDKVMKDLASAGKDKIVCWQHNGIVNVRKASGGDVTSFSTHPEFKGNPSTAVYAIALAVTLAKDAYWFKVKPHSVTLLAIAFKVGYGDGDAYFLPHDAFSNDKCNELISEGGEPMRLTQDE